MVYDKTNNGACAVFLGRGTRGACFRSFLGILRDTLRMLPPLYFCTSLRKDPIVERALQKDRNRAEGASNRLLLLTCVTTAAEMLYLLY